MKKRLRRRVDLKRMKAKAVRLYGRKVSEKLADHLAACSCWMCGNPRKWHGELTMQERRFLCEWFDFKRSEG